MPQNAKGKGPEKGLEIRQPDSTRNQHMADVTENPGVSDFVVTLKNLGPQRLAIMAITILALVVLFVFMTTRISTTDYEVLYSELDTGDASAIAAELEKLQVPYQLSQDGKIVRVDRNETGRVRMHLATQGLPSGGVVGDAEIWDGDSGGFGTTTLELNIRKRRAMEGELQRTIISLAPVRAARVHLVLPERQMFTREQTPATASVFVKLRTGGGLSREQTGSIQHLVAAAVPGLHPSYVSVVDNSGAILAPGTGDENGSGAMTHAADRTLKFETQMKTQIETMLARIIGFGKVTAEVKADLDFDRIETVTETYDPDGAVLRQSRLIEQSSNAQDRDADDVVTVGNNLPGGADADADSLAGSSENENRTEEENSWAVSKEIRNHVREAGQVQRLSVAVLVDGRYVPGPDGGEQVFEPRSEEELKRIERLVASAIGFNSERGDTLTVESQQFVEADTGLSEISSDEIMGFPKERIMKLAELLVMAIVAVLALLLIVRPILNRAGFTEYEIEDGGQVAVDSNGQPLRMLTHQGGSPHSGTSAAAGTALAQEAMQAALSNPGQAAMAQEMVNRGEAESVEAALEQLLSVSQIQGRARAGSQQKIGEIVEKHPDEAVAILRTWMYQDA
ncbi:MAG: flagellar basal-body MS-ring/collar protein FliF [Alphaproteobacteria bacterium]